MAHTALKENSDRHPPVLTTCDSDDNRMTQSGNALPNPTVPYAMAKNTVHPCGKSNILLICGENGSWNSARMSKEKKHMEKHVELNVPPFNTQALKPHNCATLNSLYVYNMNSKQNMLSKQNMFNKQNMLSEQNT